MVLEYALMWFVGRKVLRFVGQDGPGVFWKRIGVGYLMFLALVFQVGILMAWFLPVPYGIWAITR